MLLGGDGEPLAEVAVDDVRAQTLGDTTTVSRWDEVEVELVNGDRRLLRAADELLRRGGPAPGGPGGQAGAGPGPAAPAPSGPPALGPSSPAGQVVVAYLREQVEALKSMDPMVRRDEPDSVHKMRVATRRLRSTLRSFRKIIRRDADRRARQASSNGSAACSARRAMPRCSTGTCRPGWAGPRSSG